MNQNGYTPQGGPGYGFQNTNPQGEYPDRNHEYQTAPQGYPAGRQRYFQPQNSGAVQSSFGGYQNPSGQGYGYPSAAAQDSCAYPAPGVMQPAAYQAQQQPYAGETPGYAGVKQGYPDAPNAYAPVNPFPAQGIQGYPPQTQPSGAYHYGLQNAGIHHKGGYPPNGQTGTGYGISPQQGASTGSFIPPTPYSAGYQSPGYQNPNAGTQGYSPYAQMGRNQPETGRQPGYIQQIPLNGGGYVPPKVSVRRGKFQLTNLHLILAGVFLLVLFGLGMLIPSTVLNIAFLLLAIGSTVLLWIRPLTTANRRLCYTIIAAVLCLAAAATIAFGSAKKTVDSTQGTGAGNPSPSQTDTSLNASINVVDVTARPASPETTNTPEPEDASLLERVVSFFKLWSENRQDEMLALCAPSWQSKLENARTKLFSILANRKPTKISRESISGTAADTSRKVTMVVEIDRNDGKPLQTYRMTVLMVKENNEWYVQPESLASYDKVETPDPNETPTVSPTPTAAVYSSTMLYYNPNGGEYYHLDAYCRNVSKKLTPLAGQFYFSQVNDPEYANLKPCNVCGAPLREQLQETP